MPPTEESNDLWTVLAIAVVCYVGAKIGHEVIGHGVVCHLAGGDWLAVSSSWNECESSAMTPHAVRAVKAGGTLVNLVVGIAALASFRARFERPTLRTSCG